MITDLASRFGLQRSVFQSKVARRVFTLFVFAALAPILAVASLFYVQAGLSNDHLEKQQIHVTTKTMGMELFSELQDLQDRLAYLSNLPARRRPAAFRKNLGKKILKYGIFDHGARIGGQPGAYPDIPQDVRERAAHGRPTLLSAARGDAGTSLYLAVPAATPESAIMLAELNMKAIGFDLKDDDGSELCILTDQKLPTYCDPRIPHSVLSAVQHASSFSDTQSLSWVSHGTTWRGGFWTLYTAPRYRLRGLTMLWAVPASYLQKRQSSFDKILPPTIAFTLLIVVLFSINLIRRILAPLDLLKTATRTLATGDFSCRVETRSDDEFDELAGSFNVMAADIHRQFHELDTMAELDRRVLSAQGAEEITSVLLARLPEIAASSGVGIVVLEGERIQSEGWCLDGRTSAVSTGAESAPLDNAFLESLRRCDGFLRLGDAGAVPLVRPLFEAGMNDIICVPVAQQQAVSAVICLGYREASSITDEGIMRVQRIAGHAALAFSNAAWEEKLYHQAHYDALTALPNRQLFTSRLDEAVAAAARRSEFVALLFIDVDRFKSLNDTVGHNAGDEYLVCAARAMRACLGADSTLARLGGDEFTVIIPGLASSQQALEVSEDVAERLRKSFLCPVTVEGQEVALSASIGIAICPTDAEDRIALLRCADQAMYSAKDRGRNTWSYYSEEINASALERLELSAALAGALERDELAIYLQPQVDAASGRLSGAEVLLRWQHPKLGMVSPAKFIPVAEQSGLIVGIGAWVLQQACLRMQAWRATDLKGLRLAVNVSALQLRQGDFVQSVLQTIHGYGVDPGRVELEVTESMCAENVEATATLFRQLKAHGLSIAIDDFGTGYSSMRYLRQFPIDTIKIDQAFVRGLPGDSFNKALTEAILTMARNLDCSVVAEGVETGEQLDFLRQRRCETIQGYLIAKPMPVAEFEHWAAQRARQGQDAENADNVSALPLCLAE